MGKGRGGSTGLCPPGLLAGWIQGDGLLLLLLWLLMLVLLGCGWQQCAEQHVGQLRQLGRVLGHHTVQLLQEGRVHRCAAAGEGCGTIL